MENEYFIKNNICPFCEGRKYFETSRTKKSGQTIPCICEDGTYIGFLLSEYEDEKNSHIGTRKRIIELQDWVKITSTCKTCGGNQKKTLGLLTCPECGIPGTGFWPG